MKKPLLIVLLLLLGLSSFSQKKELVEGKDQIESRAKSELELAMAPPEGSIYLFVQKYGIKGEYTYDITIREKGDIVTVFVIGNNNGTIDAQNKLKDFLMEFEFNFKLPKGKYYKFRYTFTFN
jgi:hypothetical protein